MVDEDGTVLGSTLLGPGQTIDTEPEGANGEVVINNPSDTATLSFTFGKAGGETWAMG